MNIDLNQFKNARVLIAGDVMLDRYWWGSVTRISPEAPVPVVRLQGSTIAPGGAANVAANVAGLGGKPILFGAIGSDEESRELESSLIERSIGPSSLVILEGRQTIVKTRIVAHSQQVVRVDKEERLILTKTEEDKIVSAFEKAINDADITVLSDYGKGFLSDAVIEAIIGISSRLGRSVFVDPKGKDYTKYRNSTLLTPNRKEAADATGLYEDDPELVNHAGTLLRERNQIESVLITQGEQGMTLFSGGEEPFHIPASSVETYDVTGAGDTVIATLAVAHASGLGLRESAVIANAAAGEVVQHVGTTAITPEMLDNALNR